jgi:hypothetical protein
MDPASITEIVAAVGFWVAFTTRIFQPATVVGIELNRYQTNVGTRGIRDPRPRGNSGKVRIDPTG